MPNFRKDPKITVTDGSSFSLKDFDTTYTAGMPDEAQAKTDLLHDIEKNAKRQERLYAESKRSILIIFQAIDAAGKDSTIKHVMTGQNPSGISVTNFKKPSNLELAHDFLWRTTIALPSRGMMGIFNRSYYEEVLVCKVHPELILGQKLPNINFVKDIDDDFWEKRYESITDFEKHLHRNGTIILKFFLHVSKEEQKKRLLERINDPEKKWKFKSADLLERDRWKDYMLAYEQMITATATEKAPWFIIPADNKWFMQLAVGDIIHDTLKSLDPIFPVFDKTKSAEFAAAKKKLLEE